MRRRKDDAEKNKKENLLSNQEQFSDCHLFSTGTLKIGQRHTESCKKNTLRILCVSATLRALLSLSCMVPVYPG